MHAAESTGAVVGAQPTGQVRSPATVRVGGERPEEIVAGHAERSARARGQAGACATRSSRRRAPDRARRRVHARCASARRSPIPRSRLAPLHNPPGLETLAAAEAVLPDVPHVAVFDTAFHANLPPEARTYAVPGTWTRDWGIRRYGFHGLRHAYCAARAAEMLRPSRRGAAAGDLSPDLSPRPRLLRSGRARTAAASTPRWASPRSTD